MEGSARRDELLERAYAYALEHGLAGMSLRPLATAIGSSPRVLLFLFGSKDGLIRAVLARARADELALLDTIGEDDVVRAVWAWLSDERHRPLLRLWAEAYTQSLTNPDGPWAGFAQATVDDWLGLLPGEDPTLTLAVLRGALLDLLATGADARVNAAVLQYFEALANNGH